MKERTLPGCICTPGLLMRVNVSTCLSTMVYGVERKHLHHVNSAQGSAIKGILGIGRRAHHSSLLYAVYIPSTENVMQVMQGKGCS